MRWFRRIFVRLFPFLVCLFPMSGVYTIFIQCCAACAKILFYHGKTCFCHACFFNSKFYCIFFSFILTKHNFIWLCVLSGCKKVTWINTQLIHVDVMLFCVVRVVQIWLSRILWKPSRISSTVFDLDELACQYLFDQ